MREMEATEVGFKDKSASVTFASIFQWGHLLLLGTA